MPEKSGFPSAVRGVAADMSTLPSALRGAPPAEWRIHCASRELDASATIMKTVTTTETERLELAMQA
jgi:hypothetical protein